MQIGFSSGAACRYEQRQKGHLVADVVSVDLMRFGVVGHYSEAGGKVLAIYDIVKCYQALR